MRTTLRMWLLRLAVILSMVVCIVAGVAFAQSVQPAVASPIVVPVPAMPVPLPLKVIAVAGMVVAVLQGVKKLYPTLSGKYAKLATLVLAIAGAYAAAPSDSVLSPTFAITVLLGSLGSHGIYEFLKRENGGTPGPAPDPPQQ